ncbi:MAG: TolB family protein, partial [Mycobacteriales bacterium]
MNVSEGRASMSAPRSFGRCEMAWLSESSISTDNQTMPADPSTPARTFPRPAPWAALFLAALFLAALAAPAANAAEFAAPVYAGASADGGTVFFTTAEQLVPGDTDRQVDVYERSYDAEAGIERYVTREVSTGPTGGNDAYPATYDGASADGRRVFFSTRESLVAADTDRSEDVYMRNLTTGTTTLVSRGEASCQSSGCGNGPSDAQYLGASADGSEVFFATDERLASADTDSAYDIYARNVETNTTTLVSQGEASCRPACGNGDLPAMLQGISADGQKVVFTTAEKLAQGDTDSQADIYERDLGAGTTSLVSSPGTCPAGLDCTPIYGGMSGDGSHVFFETKEQISAEDHDESQDVYDWSGGTAALISTSAEAEAGNGEFPAIYAGSTAAGAVLFKTGEQLSAADADNATDIYERTPGAGTTTLVSQGEAACQPGCGNGEANAIYRGLAAGGADVFFQTSESLVAPDADTETDVYMRDLSAGTTTLVSQGEA